MLIEKFETLFDTPEAVEELRKLILDTAMRGKLVPQDPNDEPVAVLLQKIKKEKEQLVKEKQITNWKPSGTIKNDEILYKLPAMWEWVRLNDLSAPMIHSFVDGPFGSNLKTEDYTETGVRLIQLQNIGINCWIDKNKKYISEHKANSLTRCLTYPGDIVIAKMAHPVARATVVPNYEDKYIIVADCIKLTLAKGISSKYMCYALNSTFFREQAESVSTGTTRKRISLGKLRNLIVPLPPVNEQKRIVAKLDELMTFCDRLKETIIQRQKQADRLNQSAFSHLQQAETKEELQSHLNFILNHFNTLCTRKEDVQLLRQTILSLAVQGKLVPQDPNDEPASVLLERIKVEKERLVKEKKIKKQTTLPPIEDGEIPYEVPQGWEWVKAGEIFSILGGKRVPKGYKLLDNPTPYIYIRVSDMKNGSISRENNKYISQEVRSKIQRYIITSNDLYITIAGTIGAVGEVPSYFNNMNLTENAARVIVYLTNKRFYRYVLQSSFIQKQFMESVKQMAQPKLALNKIENTIIPLPPLNEQKRIVAKVDQLMSLCDQLEVQLEQSSKAAEQLLQSVLKHLFSSEESVIEVV